MRIAPLLPLLAAHPERLSPIALAGARAFSIEFTRLGDALVWTNLNALQLRRCLQTPRCCTDLQAIDALPRHILARPPAGVGRTRPRRELDRVRSGLILQGFLGLERVTRCSQTGAPVHKLGTLDLSDFRDPQPIGDVVDPLQRGSKLRLLLLR